MDTVVEKPSWSDIESAIRAMNNGNLNDVYLDLESELETSLTIGGGSERWPRLLIQPAK